MPLPSQVTVVEVAPRDGLQNEAMPIDCATKIELIERLARTGLRYIEAGSFVNPKRLPQMAGSDEVFKKLQRRPGVIYAALTPNLKGFERALEVKADEVAVFTAASETFSRKNTNCTIAESLARFEPLMEQAATHAIPVRGYISCVAGCPYEGPVSPDAVVTVARELIDMGCREISLSDTIGVATPNLIREIIERVTASVDLHKIALHLHDTYGQALANIYAALQMGVTTFDSSVAGLGGCPFAPGATGNVATEDLVYLLNGLGIEHGIDLDKLIGAGDFISRKLGLPNHSRAALAISSKKR